MSRRGCCRVLGSVLAVFFYASIWIVFDRYHRGEHVEETLTVLGGETVRVGDLVKAARRAASIAPDRTTEWENAALLAARTFGEGGRQQRREGLQKKALLCATFTNSSDAASLQHVVSNMEVMKGLCDWAVLFYDRDSSSSGIRRLEREAKALGVSVVKSEFVESRDAVLERHGVALSVTPSTLEEGLALRRSRPSSSSSSTGEEMKAFNSLVYPKSVQYMSLLDLLPQYERAWLLDADISLAGFQPDRFFQIVDCAFAAKPLVAQPLISENTQSYKFLRSLQWREFQAKDRAEKKVILATSSAFVEIQAPLVDAQFFEWFLRYFTAPLLRPSHILGADWGIDALFCKAAHAFAAASSGKTRLEKPGVSIGTDACMLVVAGSPLHHVDRRVLDGALGKAVKKRLNRALMRIVEATFPNFYKSGHDKDANMLEFPKRFHFSRSYESKTCAVL